MKYAFLSLISLMIVSILNGQLTSDNIGFSRNGTSYSPFKGRFNAVALFPDGRILAGGEIDGPGKDADFTLIAYNSQGIRDKSFGKDGIVQTAIENYNDRLTSLLMLPDGKFIAAGSVSPYGKSTIGAMVKYLTNGAPDPGFGTNGIVRIPAGKQSVTIEAITQQKDGKILLTGTITGGMDNRLVVYRFLSNGLPDPAFGIKGAVELPDKNAYGHSIAVTSSGKIAVTGYAGSYPSKYIFVAQLSTSGKWDLLFANKGIYEHRKSINDETPGGMIALPDGRLMIAGSSVDNFQLNKDSVLVFRLLGNGKPDKTFGIGGEVRYRFAAKSNFARSVLLQPDKKIVITGTTSTDNNTRGMALRLHVNGNKDTTFGSKGFAILGFDRNSQDYIHAASLQTDGKLVLAGYAISGLEWPAIGRITVNGEVDKNAGETKTTPVVANPTPTKPGNRLLTPNEYAVYTRSFAAELKKTAGGTVVAEGYMDGGNTVVKYKTISINAPSDAVYHIIGIVKYSAPVQIKVPGPYNANVTCNGERISDGTATINTYNCMYTNNTGQQKWVNFEINVQNSMEPAYYLVLRVR